MEWVERLHDKVVGLDTAPLIYFIEDHPRFAGQLSAFFEAVDRGDILVVTSVVTLVEELVRPLRQQQADLVERYKEILLASTGFDTLPSRQRSASGRRNCVRPTAYGRQTQSSLPPP